MVEIAGLKKNVGFLNWALGATFLGAIAGFLILDDRINSRISPVAADVVLIKIEGARQGVVLDEISKRIENHDQSSDGPRARQNGTIHR